MALLLAALIGSSSIVRPSASLTVGEVSPHLLAPGDVIRVTVKTQDEEMTVNPEGEIFIRGLGAVPVVGLAPDSAARDLAGRIIAAGYPVAETDVAVFLVRVAPPPKPPAARDLTPDEGVTVLGEVGKPGVYAPGRLTAVLAAAGGTTREATRRVEVRYATGGTKKIDVRKILRGEAPDEPIPAGAVINVPRAINPFRIIGEILGITRGVQGVAR